jgi:hypothetical protein
MKYFQGNIKERDDESAILYDVYRLRDEVKVIKDENEKLKKENEEWRQCVKDIINNLSCNVGFVRGAIDGMILRFNCEHCKLDK